MPIAGDFDYYLLAQSWAPSFCCKKPELCATISVHWSSTHLCLHGLWPAYYKRRSGPKSELWPSNCKTSHTFQKKMVPPLAMSYAPNYQGGLAKHEWRTHGTCTGLSAEVYFKEALRVMLSFPEKTCDRGTPHVILRKATDPGSEDRAVQVAAIRSSYPKQVAIKVDSKGVLEEITSCFEKGSSASKNKCKVGKQIDCPAHILQGFRNNVCNKKGKCRKTVKVPKLHQCNI